MLRSHQSPLPDHVTVTASPRPGVFISGFPGSSAGKESACNAGDPSSIPGLGGSPGEGIGYPPQYSWTYLVAQITNSVISKLFHLHFFSQKL